MPSVLVIVGACDCNTADCRVRQRVAAMNKYAGYVGLAVTLLTLLVGAAMSWQRLNDRVENLERKDRFEHGTYTVPQEVR